MPYGIRRRNDRWCVYNTDTDENVPGGCHDTHERALAHQRALMVNVEDATRGASAEQPLAVRWMRGTRS